MAKKTLDKKYNWLILPIMIFIFIFASFFSSLCWSSVAKYYATQEIFEGKKQHMQTISINWINYPGTTIGADETSIYIAIFPLLRLGNPPLKIPYTDIHGTEIIGIPGLKNVNIDFDNDNIPTIVVRKNQANIFEKESKNTWHYKHK